ncbi:putative peroxidase 72-like [Capsicum annuum]|nr:putative peroxidase 72-like [Capsicum annuum]
MHTSTFKVLTHLHYGVLYHRFRDTSSRATIDSRYPQTELEDRRVLGEMRSLKKCFGEDVVYHLLITVVAAVLLQANGAVSVVLPNTGCYALDNNSRIHDFSSWIGQPFEYEGNGKDADLVVRFCKDVESRSQAGYVDYGRFDKVNYFRTGSGHVSFIQEYFNGDLMNCEQSYDKMGRTAQIEFLTFWIDRSISYVETVLMDNAKRSLSQRISSSPSYLPEIQTARNSVSSFPFRIETVNFECRIPQAKYSVETPTEIRDDPPQSPTYSVLVLKPISWNQELFLSPSKDLLAKGFLAPPSVLPEIQTVRNSVFSLPFRIEIVNFESRIPQAKYSVETPLIEIHDDPPQSPTYSALAYAEYQQLDFPFSKSINVSKVWKTVSGADITAELPPSQGFTISHANSSVVASHFKRKAENEPVTGRDIKSLFEQNNYTHKYLHTLGEYLISKPSLTPKILAATTSSFPLFKPYEIPKTFTRELQMHNSKSFPQLFDLQRRIIQIEKSLHPDIPDTPGVASSATVGVLQQTNSEDSQLEEESPLEIAPVKTESSN